MATKYILYFDDTGSRDPNRSYCPVGSRRDGMDCFGLGGIMVKEEDVDTIMERHKKFCEHWRINYYLHSSSIRGKRGKFGWLKRPANAAAFLPSLQHFVLSLPFIGIACVIDRSGYVARYRERYNDRLWLMCRTAFAILIERAAKFADRNNRELEIFFEGAGRKEDGDIVQYMRALKQDGSPFDLQGSSAYAPFSPDDYRRVVLGEPRRKTKKVPMLQVADLVLYPMAKGGYDPGYPPYRSLKEAGKLIDCLLPTEMIALCGIKYSCFDSRKIKGSDCSEPLT